MPVTIKSAREIELMAEAGTVDIDVVFQNIVEILGA